MGLAHVGSDQPDVDLRLLEPKALSAIRRRRQLLRQGITNGRRGRSRVGLQPEHGSPKILEQLHPLCRSFRWNAEHLSGGVSQMQVIPAHFCAVGQAANYRQLCTVSKCFLDIQR